MYADNEIADNKDLTKHNDPALGAAHRGGGRHKAKIKQDVSALCIVLPLQRRQQAEIRQPGAARRGAKGSGVVLNHHNSSLFNA